MNVWQGISTCHVEQGRTNVHQITYLVAFHIWCDYAGKACDEGDADRSFVITAFPPAAVFPGHFAVVRAINNQRVAIEASFSQGLKDAPNLQIEIFAHAKISGTGNADAFFVEGRIKAAKLFEFANGFGFIGRVLGDIDAVVVIIKKFFVRDKGTVRQKESRHRSKGAVAGILRFVAQIRAGSFRDYFVKNVVRAISPSGNFDGCAILSGGRRCNAFEEGRSPPVCARMCGAVFAEGPIFKAVSLVVSVEVHPSNKRCFIPGESHSMCPGGNARVQQMIVVPHAIG